MRPAVIVLTTLSIVLLSGSPSAAGGGRAEAEPMPEVLHTEFDRSIGIEAPRWVSLEAAVGADGELIEERFHPNALVSLRSLLARPAEHGCIRQGAIYDDLVNPPDWTTVAKLVRNSALLVRGKVTGTAFGFQGGMPGQLIRLEPIEYLRGDSQPVESFYFFVPVGTFGIGGKVICKTDPRYAEVPDVGDEVLVAEQHRRRPAESFIHTHLAPGLVTLHHDGTLSLPQAFRGEDAPRSVVDLLERVRMAATEVE